MFNFNYKQIELSKVFIPNYFYGQRNLVRFELLEGDDLFVILPPLDNRRG
jgi:hypothetical protein